MNTGEALVASYLQHIEGCQFVQQNLNTTGTTSQGEIDVLGINLQDKTLFVCEVAIHLTTGLQYTRNNQPANLEKLTEKFGRDIAYARQLFPDHQHQFMLWSPVVKTGKPDARHSQMADLQTLQAELQARYGVSLQLVINQAFQQALEQMRAYARRTTAELKCPVLRYLQIEEHLARHLAQPA